MSTYGRWERSLRGRKLQDCLAEQRKDAIGKSTGGACNLGGEARDEMGEVDRSKD